MHSTDEGLAVGGARMARAASWCRGVVLGPKFIAFVLLTVGMGWFLLTQVHRDLFADSKVYWVLGNRFTAGGGWSLAKYDYAMRPYFFPMLLGWVQGAARWAGWDPLLLFRALSAVNFGLLCGVLAPAFVERLWGGRVALVRILGFGGLVFLFWRGHFLYPLTDFPAVTLWALAVFCVLPRTRGGKQAWWWFVIAGAALAAAFYSRPSYQVGLILLMFVAARRVFLGSGRGWRTPARLALMAVGIVVVALPQMSVNKRLTGEGSMFVSSEGLFLKQLRWGLVLQRYETNLGPGLPFADVGFIDREGVELLRGEGFGSLDEITDYGEYFSMAADHPVRFASIYTRRVFSGMDPWFSDVYVTGPIERSVWMGLLSYTMWFGFGCVLWRVLAGRGSGSPGLTDGGGSGAETGERSWRGRMFDTVGALVVFCAPVGLAVPSAVEPRFFLPAHLVVYGVVCFGAPGGGAWRGLLARRRAPLWVLFVVFVLACNMVSSWMFASLLRTSGAHVFMGRFLSAAVNGSY